MAEIKEDVNKLTKTLNSLRDDLTYLHMAVKDQNRRFVGNGYVADMVRNRNRLDPGEII